MASEKSPMLNDAERALQETHNKHQILLKEYANLTGFGQRDTQSQKARVLQSLVYNTRQSLVHQKKMYDMKSKTSSFLQYARNVKDSHDVMKQCFREVDHLKMPKSKSLRKLCKGFTKKRMMLDRCTDDIDYVSELLGELPLDDYDIDAEDETLTNDLADLSKELVNSMPPPPLSEVESGPTVSSLTTTLKKPV
jgi:hypothetical protein